jgi:cell division protease FtsH
MMGGRLAEELCLDQITTGASNDFEQATTMARRMVCEWGMSDLGPMTFGHEEGEVFLGRDFARRPDYSEDTARKIDAEVNRIVITAYQRGKQIILENRPALDAIAAELLEKESLDGEEVYALIERASGKKVPHATKSKPQASLPGDPAAPATAAGKKEEGPGGAPTGLVPAPV